MRNTSNKGKFSRKMTTEVRCIGRTTVTMVVQIMIEDDDSNHNNDNHENNEIISQLHELNSC